MRSLCQQTPKKDQFAVGHSSLCQICWRTPNPLTYSFLVRENSDEMTFLPHVLFFFLSLPFFFCSGEIMAVARGTPPCGRAAARGRARLHPGRRRPSRTVQSCRSRTALPRTPRARRMPTPPRLSRGRMPRLARETRMRGLAELRRRRLCVVPSVREAWPRPMKTGKSCREMQMRAQVTGADVVVS